MTALTIGGLLALFGCRQENKPTIPPQPNNLPATRGPVAAPIGAPKLEEVTRQAGIDWTYNPCRTGKKYLPETVGGGGGFIDYNHDGLLDVLLINGAPLPGYKGSKPHLALYRNNGDGTFTDATGASGLTFEGYGLGLAVGDYDNDGWPDIYITAVGESRLFHNEHGKFRDVTGKAGVGVKGFATGAAWIDTDHDGRLDLFVARYVEWTPQTDLPCGPANARQYCPPNQYKGAPPVLFHQRADGTFEDVSKKAGVLGHPSKTLAVTSYDFNGDGWTDLYLANDTEPDVLLINNHDGTFTDKSLSSGVAVGMDGSPTGSMGVDVATPFNDGRAAIAVGVFAGQQLSLFVASPQNSGDTLLFENRQQEAGVAGPTRAMTTFGLLFADIDMDGWPDLLVMNGHIDDDPSLHVGGVERIPYRQTPQLFQNQHNGTFKEVGAAAGLTMPLIGRGLAMGDYDNDGKPDFLFFENGGPVRLFHNVSKFPGDWLGVELIGKRSPRDGTGAMVTLSGKGWTQTRCATTARSYLSASDPRLLFGVPPGGVESLTVRWSSGAVTTVAVPKLNGYLRVEEK